MGALLLTIFAAELAVTELLSPLFPRLSLVQGALLNAALLVSIAAVPLWFFFARRLPDEDPVPGRARPAVALIQVLVGVFIVEYLAMLLLPQLVPYAGRARCLADAALTAGGGGFLIRRFLMRPQIRVRSIPLMDTPLRLYVLLLCAVFLSGLLQELVLPLLAPGGFLAPALITDALLTTLFGAPLLWLLVVRPLKREARSEKTRVAAVHAQVIDAIVTLDAQGVITSCNPAAQGLFGYRAAGMIGASGALLLNDGRRGLDRMIEGVAACRDRQAPARLTEIGCRRRDGSTMIMNVSISEVLLEERRPEFLLIMRDITRRKEIEQALLESETRFREIFHQSEDAILFFKPGGCAVIDANANAEKIFGYPRGELLERGLALISEPADHAALTLAVSGIREGRSVQQDFLCRRRDQAVIVVSMRGKVMVLQGIPVTYCTFRDVTERVRMEERTRDIQAKLIQTNKMTSLGLLVSGVAHEINNPNNFIMANSELLAKISHDSLKLLNEYTLEHRDSGEFYIAGIPFSELGEHWMRLLDGILDGSRRVNDIVNNLKGFARQERDQVRRDVDVNRVARSAVTLLHHELIKFTDNFHLELADTLPPVPGHSQQLGQVIINLLMNACQALPGRQGGIWLATSFDPEEAAVVISVRDEGRGMSREEGQRIMEQFFTTKLDSGGTGLGLSISESIVKEHGGCLEFASEPGRGTSFAVLIPASNGSSRGGEGVEVEGVEPSDQKGEPT